MILTNYERTHKATTRQSAWNRFYWQSKIRPPICAPFGTKSYVYICTDNSTVTNSMWTNILCLCSVHYFHCSLVCSELEGLDGSPWKLVLFRVQVECQRLPRPQEGASPPIITAASRTWCWRQISRWSCCIMPSVAAMWCSVARNCECRQGDGEQHSSAWFQHAGIIATVQTPAPRGWQMRIDATLCK